MYGRKDKGPRFATPGFEHPNNFVLFDDGVDVFVRRIDNDESLTTNLVQHTKTPLSKECTNYTMTIMEIGKDEFVMVGVTNKCVPDNPMWTIDRSVRYHSNDGGVFNGGMGIKTYHTYEVGDKITCRLDYNGPDRCLINFLKNDRLVYRQWANLPPGQLYPTIGVSRTEAKLKVEWPKPGAGDIHIRTDLPSNWFGWTGIKRYDDTMVVTLEEKDTEMEREAYNIQCPTVLSQDFSYFEIEVLKLANGDGDKKGCCAIGLVAGNCEPFVMPGWTMSTIGYHSDDGGLLIEAESKSEESTKGAECKEGDKMGCGIVFPQINASSFREPILVLVYFTKNGELVYKKRMRQPRGGFFPSVGFLNQDSIKLDVNCKPPSSFQNDLMDALNLADVSSDFRCSEVIHFQDLAADSAVFTLSLPEDNPQLIQYLRYPLVNIGDGFSIEVKLIQQNTEIQLGVSMKDHPMEGDFLGSSQTSCGYLLKLGSLAMKEGMRTVSAWSSKKDIISCYLDFKDDKIALICFEKQTGEMIGRALVSCVGNSNPLLASVVASAGPCTMKMDWSRSIYNARYIDRKWGEAETWIKAQGIKGDKNKLYLKTTDHSYSFAACVQCRQPMLTGTSYFGIRLLGGESLPGIGLSKPTTDVNNLLGSENGEVCFLPSKGELIIQNCKWSVKNAPTFKAGDTLHCGFAFAEADRVEQKGVVYFCHNNNVFYHCRFTTAHGGVYPTITLASKGCTAELLETSRAQPLPESLTSEWLNEEIMTDVERSEAMNSSDYNDKVDNMSQEDLKIVSSDNKNSIIYISHTIRERSRVDPIIQFLRRNYLNYVFETSGNCVELTDKQAALNQCEFVVILMSQIYTESHEMAMEYSLVINSNNGKKAKPILVAADRGMEWPPGNFFKNEGNIKQYPCVFVSSVSDKEGMYDLMSMLDKEMKKHFHNGTPQKNRLIKLDADNHSLCSSGSLDLHEGQATMFTMKAGQLKKKSGFCHIL